MLRHNLRTDVQICGKSASQASLFVRHGRGANRVYSALVNSVFLLIRLLFFGLTLTFVYKYTICMAWRFHFPPRKYDINVLFVRCMT